MTDTTMQAPTDSTATASDGATTDATEVAKVEAQTPEAKALLFSDTTEDSKPEDKAAEDGDKTEDEAPEGAPEAYEDFTAPEGVEFDAELVEELKVTAKELNLPQASAQKLADMGAKLATKWATQQAESVASLRKEWVDTVKTDKEIGGDDKQVAENLAGAKKVIDTFGTPELRELLNGPVGDHPELIRLLTRVSKAISEDTLVGASSEPKAQPKSFADAFFSPPAS